MDSEDYEQHWQRDEHGTKMQIGPWSIYIVARYFLDCGSLHFPTSDAPSPSTSHQHKGPRVRRSKSARHMPVQGRLSHGHASPRSKLIACLADGESIGSTMHGKRHAASSLHSAAPMPAVACTLFSTRLTDPRSCRQIGECRDAHHSQGSSKRTWRVLLQGMASVHMPEMHAVLPERLIANDIDGILARPGTLGRLHAQSAAQLAHIF